MKRHRKRIVLAVALVAVLVLSYVGLQVWLWKSPLVVVGTGQPGGQLFDSRTAAGRVFDDVQECGEQQKDLYGCIEAYRDRNERLPADMDELINDIHEAMAFDDCPAGLAWYDVHFENYGKPDAVLIEEHENKHPTCLALWIRGYKPQVETMGNGTIHLFANGQLATIQAKRSN